MSKEKVNRRNTLNELRNSQQNPSVKSIVCKLNSRTRTTVVAAVAVVAVCLLSAVNAAALCDPRGPEPRCPSPIIIDTDGKGFHLTSAEDGVQFDITGDGRLTQMAWTASGSTNA